MHVNYIKMYYQVSLDPLIHLPLPPSPPPPPITITITITTTASQLPPQQPQKLKNSCLST